MPSSNTVTCITKLGYLSALAAKQTKFRKAVARLLHNIGPEQTQSASASNLDQNCLRYKMPNGIQFESAISPNALKARVYPVMSISCESDWGPRDHTLVLSLERANVDIFFNLNGLIVRLARLLTQEDNLIFARSKPML